jgi:hypothetical protein
MKPIGMAGAAMLLAAGCSGGSLTPVDGSAPGTCGVGVPAGQPCNSLEDVGSAVTPTCTTGAMPSGTGGTLVDGTYVLTAQTYYNEDFCPGTPISGTILIAGNCVQSSTASLAATTAGPFTVQGNVFNYPLACLNIPGLDAGDLSPDAPGKTFTATATTFTLYTANAAAGNPNPDRVEVYARR